MVQSIGKDRRIMLSADGTPGGALKLLECQGASTFNTGKSANRKKFKDCTVSSIQNEGASISTQFAPRNPMSEGQVLAYAAHDQEKSWYAELLPTKAGLRGYKGMWKIVITQEEDPEDGSETMASIELSEDGDPIEAFIV